MNMPPNLKGMLEQAQKLQEDMAAAQDKLKDERVEATSGGGMVKVVATGEGQILELTIDPDAVDPEDVEMLQDMILAAANEALRQADELREKAMGETAGFDPMEALSGLGLGGGGLPQGTGNRAARRATKKKK